MDMPKLFELFKVISSGQAFTKIPDAERYVMTQFGFLSAGF